MPETPSGSTIGETVRPIIVITSNEERQLPDAFLRRCIFHEIAFPNSALLARIVESGLRKRLPPGGGASADHFVLPEEEAELLIGLMLKFRELPLEKKPGVSELIDAATLMAYPSRSTPPPVETRARTTIAALAKLKLDRDAYVDLLNASGIIA